MKKASEPFHGGKYESSEVSRRLYRSVVEAARRLEERLHRVSSQQDLLGPEVTALRMKLKDYCERLMFADPVEYGRKAEELMWRKVYYDIIQQCKQQHRKNQEMSSESYLLHSSLMAGMGNYHHLLMRLQTEFHLDLEGKVDVPFVWQQKGIKKGRWKKYQRCIEVDEGILDWTHQACHRFLICLGDLARYMSDFGHLESTSLAERYYYQAFNLNPALGMPHNQLGTLAGMTNYGCDAVYHYLRCLKCPQPFEGAEGNLQRVFDKNGQFFKEVDSLDDTVERSLLVKRFLARYMKLTEQFFLAQDDSIQLLCQDTLQDFSKCMMFRENYSTINGDSAGEGELKKPMSLTDGLVFKLVVMSLICVNDLHEKGCLLASAATAFVLTLFSHTLCHCFRKLQQLLYPPTMKVPNLLDNGIRAELDEEFAYPTASETTTPTTTSFSAEIVESAMARLNLNNAKKCLRKDRCPKKRSTSRRRIFQRCRKESSTSLDDSEFSEGEIQDPTGSDIEEKLNSDLSETEGSCSSESATEQEEGDLSDGGEVISNNTVGSGHNYSGGNKLSKCTINLVEDQIVPSISSKPITIFPNGELKETQSQSSNMKDDLPISKNGVHLQHEITLRPAEVLQVLTKDSLLCIVKVLTTWMRGHPDIVTACAESSQILWTRVVDLLNLLLKAETKIFSGGESLISGLRRLKRADEPWKQHCLLPEDISVQHLPFFSKLLVNIAVIPSQKKHLSYTEQAYLRVQCVLDFGHFLASYTKTGIVRNQESGNFDIVGREEKCANGTISPDNHEIGDEDVEFQRKQLMRNMAHLWLKAEVQDLEVLVGRGPTTHLSPYVVPDAGSLCSHLPLLKQLVATKRFIVVVPSVVIATLDHLKRDSVGAREAIRWLEIELRRGSRYLRAQKRQEKQSLTPMKYPKRKEKDAWDFFQVLECCHYLNHQGSGGDPSAQLVTLLSGNSHLVLANAIVWAQTAGIAMENIETFVSKWQTSFKSQG